MARYDDLPLFPLDLVLYPGERLPLHIFEPRYREMTARCLREDLPFGILWQGDGAPASVGCTARLDRILEKYPDGRVDLLVRGEARFHVVRMREGHPYLSADVETVDEPREPVQRRLVDRAIVQHMRLLELGGRTVRPSLYEGDRVSYVIAHNAGLTNAQKQEVLELLTENLRIAYLVGHLEDLIRRAEQVDDVRRKVRSNGHFRDFLASDE